MADENKKSYIRFIGFDDEWQQLKLSDISDKVTEKNGSLIYSETFTNSAEFGIISQTDFFDHNISNRDNIGGYYVVKNDDFVYNPRISTSAPVGPINRNRLGRTGVMSPLYSVFGTHDIDNTYLEQYFKSSYWHSFMRFNGDTGARSDRFSIKDSVLTEMPIPYPPITEQQKIGLILESIDYLIINKQRKYDKLQNIKTSMLEKMFPKDGAIVPEIRFTGFTDVWELQKLSTYLETSTEKNFNGNYSRENVLSVSGSQGIVNQIEFHGRSFAGISVLNYGVVHTGDIVYTKSPLKASPFGIIKTNKGAPGIVSTLYAVYKPLNGIHPNFIQCYFDYEFRLNKYLMPLVSKGAKNDMKISADNALTGLVVFPGYKEQIAIAEFFECLDSHIVFHQQEFGKLKNLKKSMMERMFV